MTQALKHILLDIAQLPLVDQRWIIRQLSQRQHETLAQYQGLKLLTEAQRFRGLKISKMSLPNRPEPLPIWSQQLAHQTPLFVAIVLAQSSPYDPLSLGTLGERASASDPLSPGTLGERARVRGNQTATSWQTRFLKQFDQDGAIQTLMQHEIPHIKRLTQKTLFEEWTRTLPFAAQLEECHG